jgi:hypothetical protein
MKYGNKKIDLDGHSFSSKLEASVYCLIKHVVIQCQDHIYLTDARILYIPDFKCADADGKIYWVEAKGLETDVYRIKRRLWKHYGPGQLHVYKGTAARPFLHEIIHPA